MEKALKRTKNTKEKLWGVYITKHPDGYHLSQFKAQYLNGYKSGNPVMHVGHKDREKMCVDYAGEKPSIIYPCSA
jgi:hypothetical protein